MEVPNYCYLFTLLYMLVPHAASTKHACAPGMDSIGWNQPQGDIFVLYGEPLEIFCTLDPERQFRRDLNSSSLYFKYDGDEVEKDYYTVVNETTIRLFMERPPRWRKLFTCNLRLEKESQLVCLNYVFIGECYRNFSIECESEVMKQLLTTESFNFSSFPVNVAYNKPLHLQNFDCVSYNWESLNCSWTRVPNFIPTLYNVSFALKKTNYKYHFPCPGSTEKNYCLWNASSVPTYRLLYTHYYFVIRGTNKFGELTQIVTLDHYASVIPQKPVNLSVIAATSESLAITWAVPISLQNFPPGLTYKIMYQSKYDFTNTWQTIFPVLDNKSAVLNYNITGLKYAHTLYDVRVMMKPTIANDKKWSEPATTTFHTNETVPGAPPKVAHGGFEIRNPTASTRDIYLYWQQIPEYLENGENFEYKISRVLEYVKGEPVVRNILPSSMTKTYALFKSMSQYRYDFTIVSSNRVGQSSSSSITVSGKDTIVPEPVNFIKSSYDHGIWELNWKMDPNVTSYTIFWCDNKWDRPYECQGFLNWTQVYIGREIKGDVAAINITLPVDKVYQIALSANTERSSSGMVWAYCILLSGTDSNKLKTIWISKISSDFIEINWIFDCIRIREGFQLRYCPIKDPEKPTCKEPEKSIAIKGKATDSHAIIRGLKPYTTYSVHFVTLNNVPLSKTLLNTTLEAAPDKPPENVKVRKVTNSSVYLTWDRPKSLNGVLRHYILHWNNNSTRVENQTPVVEYTLMNLQSYNNYSIKVQACTTACSGNSTLANVQTHVGSPGIIALPLVRFLDKSDYSMVVTWYPPREPGGSLLYYDVRVKLSDGNSILKEKHYETKSTRIEIPTRECQGAVGPKYYFVDVSAVNLDENGLKLNGPWSIPGEGNCLPGPPSLPVMILMFAVGILALMVLCISVVYVIRYVWIRCKAMQNVGVKLPPQLELNHGFKDKGGMDPMSSHVCPPQLKQIDVKESSPPDQQLLLDKKDKEESIESSPEDGEEGCGDQESSGCGSGHDSVSSSITAGSHITDSGTEADERPSTPDIFGNSHARKNDSRQLNVSLSGSGGEGYSRLAAAPSNNGYVTISPSSRGYVSHPPLWSQNPSKGYVTVGPHVNLQSPCD